MFEFNQLQPLAFHESDRLQLTINEADREFVWHQAQHHSNPISRYNAYLNGVCLKTFLNWLSEWLAEEAFPQPSVWHGQDLASIWEVVNGTAFQIGETRLVLIPSDEGELEEFCVPQEWVDIPNWSADYYLPVQMNLDGDDGECWIELCGFATHRQLKNDGRYNAGDRTYCLAIEELTESLTVMQLTFGLNLQQEVSPLPSLSEGEAAKLLQLLSDSSIYSPRLRVTFEQWAAFLANDELRQLLYGKRLGILEKKEVASGLIFSTQDRENLVQRVKNYLQEGWQTVEEITEKLGILEPNFVYALEGNQRYRDGYSSTQNKIPTVIELLKDKRNKGNQWRVAELLGRVEPGNAEAIAALTDLLQTTQDDILRRQAAVSLGKIDPKNASAGLRVGKIINLEMRLDTERVVLVVTLFPEGSDKTNVHLRVSPVRSQTLPPNLELLVLDEGGEIFGEERTDMVNDSLEYEFTADLGDYFQVKVALQQVSVTEDFTI
ncbi:DUF1822 family protein [Microcoleus sp. PH2017_02_FOX_O_A]|uniref:DUF1822 family protein n=1 Tax=Microcoleus sp. PH2017_02_FOX_O_A TaxID=2798813 RepID=UPI001D81C8A8|nr:DUF1822 family protein [Microcoleus sp. PH2017_02_FOX_O_A]MCC3413088.1 DUF1822 family protein [Microcoleus sp. PH2017_02_FOX_O_A]